MKAHTVSCTKVETVLLIGISFDNAATCSCVVEITDSDDPVEMFLKEKDFHIENLDELLIVRDGFKVEQVRCS